MTAAEYITGHMVGQPRPERCARRRGVLLLVVLSMLTLFLMLGAAYLLTTSRALDAAKAYSKLTLGTNENRIPHGRLLDSVMLQVVRGGGTVRSISNSGTVPLGTLTISGTGSIESLLADKYGLGTLTGTMTGCTPLTAGGTAQLVFTGGLTTGSSVQPTDLVGRVLTLTAAGRAPTSHRIVRAQRAAATDNGPDTSFTLTLDASNQKTGFTFPANSASVIINGREFNGDGSRSSPNESWDGFDAKNDYLAQVGPHSGTVSLSTVSRGSFLNTNGGIFYLASASGSTAYTTGTALVTILTSGTDVDGDLIPDAADNDNDGVVDGAFVDWGIPDILDSNGTPIQVRASVLVVDLDGRFNINAHDSLSRILYTGTNFTSGSNTNWPSAITTGSIPVGSGYGPAEIDVSKLQLLPSLGSSNERPLLFSMVGGGTAEQMGIRPAGSRYTAGGGTYRLDTLEGRYGEYPAAGALAASLPSTVTLASSTSRFPLPGVSGTNDAASNTVDRQLPPTAAAAFNNGVPPFWWLTDQSNFNWAAGTFGGPAPRAIFNSPPDLHGRMIMTTATASGTSIAPHLQFAKPDWPTTSDPLTETRDDPYESQLETRYGRGGFFRSNQPVMTGTLADNPFTLAELESVLRPYDHDTRLLAPRLSAILGSVAESLRCRVTTDSWDTTAIVGGTNGAAGRIFGSGPVAGWLASATASSIVLSDTTTPTLGLLGGEISRGEKFNLNRPLAPSGTAPAAYNSTIDYYRQRQAYFKDLYTLLVILKQGTSSTLSIQESGTLAQWAANVAEFRDADSIITPFEYDVNPRNGWGVDGDITNSNPAGDVSPTERLVVWGAERPEILLRETFAWENSALGVGGMVISLHRPWNATAYATGTAIDAEVCDYSLDTLAGGTLPLNKIDLAKSGTTYSGTQYPVWRLRLVGGGTTTYVRLDTTTAATGEFAIASLSPRPTMDPDSTLTLRSGSTVFTGTGTGPPSGTATISDTNSTTTHIVTGLRMPAGATSGTVFLDRLCNPSQATFTLSGSAAWTADPLIGSSTTTTPTRYITVDTMPVTVVSTTAVTASSPLQFSTYARQTAGTIGDFWATGTSALVSGSIPLSGGMPILSTGTGSIPKAIATGSTAWFPWHNRPFVSAAELLLVPQGDSLDLLEKYQVISASNQMTRAVPVPLDLLLDCVHVPTRFAGIHTTGTNDISSTTAIFNTITPVNQLSSFREPGRVNLNTAASDDVWNAVVTGRIVSGSTVASGSAFRPILSGTPAPTLANLLAFSGAVSGSNAVPKTDVDPNLPGNRNPAHEFYTATRLANTVTPRSNVFAVWVTLRESVANDPDSVRYHRAFYIIDRSIPVGFEVGQDHNVHDCIRLRRIIE